MMEKSKFPLLIIEGHKELQSAFSAMASDYFDPILLAASCAEAREKWHEDIATVWFEYSLPDGNGLSLFKDFKKLKKEQVFIMVTRSASKDLVLEATNMGIDFIFDQPDNHVFLRDSLPKCQEKSIEKSKINYLLAKYSIKPFTLQLLQNEYHISNREIEVLELAINHNESDYIAQKLFISTATVRKHVRSIYLKLEVNSRTELRNLIYKMNKSSHF